MPTPIPAPGLEPAPGSGERLSRGEVAGRLVLLVALLFAFLVAIETMSKAIKGLCDTGLLGGEGGELFGGIQNPFAGLSLGVLFTVLVQSSSTTTSTIVAVVGSGALSVEAAVPMIMGANIGTTITNTLVSLGSIRRSMEFQRAFAAATVHDFFNLLCVAVLLPLELSTRLLSRSAAALAGWLAGGGARGAKYDSPIKHALKEAHKALVGSLESLGLEGSALQGVALVVGIALTFVSLVYITKNMRRVLAGKIEVAMNRALESSGLVPLAIGIALTVAVQSSSITTSLLVPMCAAGVLSLGNAFPVMLGANIGTTVTALLASLAQERPEALTIALVHTLFNCAGVLLFYPVPALRKLPLGAAAGLAGLATRSRLWVVVYVAGVFVLLPLCGWLLWGGR
jgi:sodium-dependent phosphate cotransporter